MLEYDQLARTIRRAMECGGRPTSNPSAWEWDVGAFCDTPVARTLHARDYKRGQVRMVKWTTNPRSLTLHLSGLPCRQCAKCLRVRASHWRGRALKEVATWQRTWMTTFTLTPHEHSMLWMRELSAREKRGYCEADFPDGGWKLRADGVGKLLTNYLKRLRKGHDGQPTIRFRYLAVTEKHKSGLPHLHMLLHEVADPIPYRRIVGHWPHGFAGAKLVTGEKAAWYVTKYVSKDALARVRPSQRYGRGASQTSLSALASLLQGKGVTPLGNEGATLLSDPPSDPLREFEEFLTLEKTYDREVQE